MILNIEMDKPKSCAECLFWVLEISDKHKRHGCKLLCCFFANFFPNKRWERCPFDNEYTKTDNMKIKVKNTGSDLQLELEGV